MLGLVLAGSSVAWHTTGRGTIAGATAWTIALWPPVHHAPAELLLAAIAIALVPSLRLRERWSQTAAGALLAGAGMALLAPSPMPVALAALLGALLAALRPSNPTVEAIGWQRSAWLFLPAIGLLGLFLANIALEPLEGQPVLTLLLAGTGAGLLFTFLALAGLGLATWLESDDPHQVGAWLALGTAGAVVLATLVERDPSFTIEAVAVLAGPASLLAVVATTRLHASLGRRVPWAWLALAAIVLGQIGLISI